MVRFVVLAVALALCAASATQQGPQPPSNRPNDPMDPTFCSEACQHYQDCKGTSDQTAFVGCVRECRANDPDPQSLYAYSHLACDEAIRLTESGE